MGEINQIILNKEDDEKTLAQKISGFLEDNGHTFVLGMVNVEKDSCMTIMNGSPRYIAATLDTLVTRFSQEAENLAQKGEQNDG